MFDYKLVVSKLNEALFLVSGVLSETQVDNIRSFISAGEWSLALEFLCDMLLENELPVHPRAYELFQETGTILDLKSENWEMLKPQVINIFNNS